MVVERRPMTDGGGLHKPGRDRKRMNGDVRDAVEPPPQPLKPAPLDEGGHENAFIAVVDAKLPRGRMGLFG